MRGSRAILRRIESRALMSSGCRVEEAASCGREIDDHFYMQRTVALGALDRRLLLEELGIEGVDGIGLDIEGHLLVLGRHAGFDIPVVRAYTLGAVAHQPVDVVFTLAQVEIA